VLAKAGLEPPVVSMEASGAETARKA
jgi:hypothetical protein